MNEILKAALDYHAMGMSVIPVPYGTKAPVIKWVKYQSERPTQTELHFWFGNGTRSNLGIVTGRISGIVVVDVDDKALVETVRKTLFPGINPPCVSTPRGFHFYFRYPQGIDLRGRASLLRGVDIRAEGGQVIAPPSRGQSDLPYAWTNDMPTSIDQFPEIPQSILRIYRQGWFVKKEEREKEKEERNNIKNIDSFKSIDSGQSNALSFSSREFLPASTDVYKRPQTSTLSCLKKGRRDEDLFCIANALVKAKRFSISEIAYMLEILAKSCDPEFPDAEVRRKIESALQRVDRRERALAEEVKEYLSCLQGSTVSRQELYTCLRLSTREEKKNLYIILRRLEERDKIIKKTNRTGIYAVVNPNNIPIDLKDKSDLLGELPVVFPFGLEHLIKPMPGCVYIIAGEPDSGKSAFLLNFAKLNTPKFHVHYLSSEMGKAEILDRLQHFWPEAEQESRMHFWEKYGDYDEFIDQYPDDLIIVDYLKEYESPYLIPKMIEMAGQKLRNGIVFIAIQKPRGRDEGQGGEGTKHLSRLYLSLGRGKLKIIKAKNWRDSKYNPNGLAIEFKLHQGGIFENITPWRREW